MIDLSLNEIALTINAKIITHGDSNQANNLIVKLVCTDTRELAIKSKSDNSHTLFVALKGPQFDGSEFAEAAQQMGVAALVVNHSNIQDNCSTSELESKTELEKSVNPAIKVPQLVVNNSSLALAKIAKLVREKSKAKYIAVTGSSGKTTVKEMIASILSFEGKTFATHGNFNNTIGVPLSLLNIENITEFAVLELGASQIGEIAFTADLVMPDVALVNNVSGAHLEGFGDLQGVAQAKSEIYQSLSSKGTAVINLDDDFSNYFKKQCNCKLIGFSVEHPKEKIADIFGSNITLDEQQKVSFDFIYDGKSYPIKLPLLGKHNVRNALAAASSCLAINISIESIIKGLTHVQGVSGRLDTFSLTTGCRLIDDTYNANLNSIKAAIDLLSESPSPRVLVLGDMAELGDFARQSHEEVGIYAQTKNIDVLYTNGEFTKLTQQVFKDESQKNKNNQKGQHFSDQKELIETIKNDINDFKTILVKGSRSAHMERVVDALKIYDSSNTNTNRKTITKKLGHKDEAQGEIA